ncbi:MAG: 2-methylcitrate dehydratase [Kordiimonadales bacterium]|nr:MAG: 2-methylcitrate dehydratase [Kordiimonadales bacterium]
MTKTTPNPLHAFAHWVTTAERNWSDTALERANNAFIDTVAVMIAGAHEAVTDKVRSLAISWGKGGCNVVGTTETLSAPMAALANGTAAHALDFDDDFDPAKAHPSAVLIPALIALADDRRKTTEDLLDAYIVGLQIIGLVGQGVNPYHRSRGWHATGTVSAIGAAAGCARLLKLSAQETAQAISLATSMAGGFMSQFGTMAKPMHAGFAAAGAVKAALFAETGITAGAETLHGEHGMGTLMVGPDVAVLRETMKNKDQYGQKVEFRTASIGVPLHIEKYGVKVKRFPNCGSTHRALDALMVLQEKHGFAADKVERVFVRAPAMLLKNLAYDDPQTPSEAKFSLEYNIAVALLYGNVRLADFDPKAIKRTDVQEAMQRVAKEAVSKLDSEFPTEVHVFLTGGGHLTAAIDRPVGSSERPLSQAQLWEKFDACTKIHMTQQDAASLQKRLLSMQDAASPSTELTEFLTRC